MPLVLLKIIQRPRGKCFKRQLHICYRLYTAEKPNVKRKRKKKVEKCPKKRTSALIVKVDAERKHQISQCLDCGVSIRRIQLWSSSLNIIIVGKAFHKRIGCVTYVRTHTGEGPSERKAYRRAFMQKLKFSACLRTLRGGKAT